MAGGGQHFKLTAEVPVYGSVRHTTYAIWAEAFTIYTDNFPLLSAALAMDPATPFAAYTVAERRSNAALRLVLQQALDQEHWSIIGAEPRARCNLDRLRRMATSSDLSHATELQVQLTTLRMSDKQSLRSYFAHGVNLQTRLNGINLQTPDATLIMWLLRGLPPAYDHYKDIAKLHPEANTDVYSMLAFLQVHEVKYHVRETGSSAANGASHRYPQKCYQCGSTAHTVTNCPIRLGTARVSAFQRLGTSPLSCSHCGKPGHSADRCYILHPSLRSYNPSPASSPGPPGPPSPHGLTCTHCHRTGHTADRCYHIIGFPRPPSAARERSRSPVRATARVNAVDMDPRNRASTPFSLQE